MALLKIVYGVKTPILARIFAVYGVLTIIPKAEKPLQHNQKLATSEDFNCKDNLSAIRAMNSEARKVQLESTMVFCWKMPQRIR